MARKTKTSKNTEENQADETPVSEDQKTESTESEALDSDSEVTSDAPAASGAEPDGVESEPVVEAAPAGSATDDSSDSVSSLTDSAADEADDAKGDVDTEVAGVVPSQAEPPVAPSPAPAVTVNRDTSGPGAFALVFGGLVAGAIGFLVATFAVPEGWPNPAPETDGVTREERAALTSRVETLATELTEFSVPEAALPEPVDLGPLEAGIDSLRSAMSDSETRLNGLSGTLEAIEARLVALEERPVVSIPDGSAAMEAQLQAFRADLDAVTNAARAEIEAARARASQIEMEAAEAAAAAARQAAISEIAAALESGAAFSGAAARLGDVPDGLQSASETGVRTLSSLQDDFPAQARAALQATQTVPGEASAGDRMVAFLRRQTNARSLAPKEGDDADAILSRAEAALSVGDLETALTEIATLPDGARAAMGQWIEGAQTRQAAVSSLGQLN